MALTTVPASLSATAITLTTAAQPNITSVGTLTGLTVNGNIAGTLTTAAQTNITSVGTLSSLSVGAITSTGKLTLNDSTYAGWIQSNGSVRIDIDNDNNQTDRAFVVSKNNGATSLLTLSEDASATFAGGITTSGSVGFRTAADSNYAFVAMQNGSLTHGGYMSIQGATATGLEINSSASSSFSGTVLLAKQSQRTSGGYLARFANSADDQMVVETGGNVGIGTATPQKKLHIEHAAGASEGILISGASDTAGHTAGILLRAEGGESDSDLRAKGGIFFERTGTFGVGKLHLANDLGADNTSATISDAKLTIDENGDVGIGTTTPDEFGVGSAYRYLAVGGSTVAGIINLVDSSTTGSYLQFGTAAGLRRASIHAVNGSHLAFTVNNLNSGTTLAEAMRISNIGNVGIDGAPATYNSAYRALQVSNSALIARRGSTSETYLTANAYYSAGWKYIKNDEASVIAQSGGEISFLNAASGNANAGVSWDTRMKIDTSGDLIVGGTSSGQNDAVSISNTGYIQAIINNDTAAYFNRRTNDGEIIRIQKDGGTVGTIGSNTASGTPVLDIGSHSSSGLIRVLTSGAERMRFNSNGSITVGVNGPPRSVGWGDTKLQIEGTGATDSSISIIRNEAGNNPPYLVLGKSRGSSIGSSTVVQNNDDLGTIRWVAADGAGLENQAAQISAQVDGTPGNNDTPGRLMFFTSPDGSNSAQERMRIDSSGDVSALTGAFTQNPVNWYDGNLLRRLSLGGPSSSGTFIRTINISTQLKFTAHGGAFMYMLHGWMADRAAGMVSWRNPGNSSQVISDVYQDVLFSPSGITVTASKGSGDLEIDLSIASAHSNSHGWYFVIWW